MKAVIQTRHQTDRNVLKDVLPIETPYAIGIWTGDICNIKCKYCVNSIQDDKLNPRPIIRKFLDMELFEKAVEQICEFPDPIKTVSFSSPAGEPLMNRNLPYMIKRMKDTGRVKNILVVTNGLLLTKEKSLQLIDSGISQINISLQGITEEVYNQVCGVNMNMSEFLENLKFLYENKEQCRINMKTLDMCLKDGEDKLFYEMFGDYCDFIHIDNVIPLYPTIDYTSMVKKGKSLFDDKPKKHDICPMVFYSIYVQPDGSITPCCTNTYPALLGNIADVTLYNAFNGEKRRAFLRMMLERKRHNHPVCGSCITPDVSIYKSEDELDSYAEMLLPKYQ